jgi:hypothetical protein
MGWMSGHGSRAKKAATAPAIALATNARKQPMFLNPRIIENHTLPLLSHAAHIEIILPPYHVGNTESMLMHRT